MTIVSLLMVWSEATTLGDRFRGALRYLDIRKTGRTYQGWVKASKRLSPMLFHAIADYWLTLVQRVAGSHWKTDGWTVFAVDGSKFDLPRTAANEKAFGTSGKNNGGPQAYLCAILHLATGLPWCWKIGKTMSSERGMLRQMLRRLPAGSLLVADAGFTGYDLWRTMDEAGQAFLIRAGANVRFLRPKGGKMRVYGNLVYLWPAKAQRRGRPPVILRITYIRAGKKTMCLATNVMDSKKLTDQQIAQFYQWRWGIELWFRAMKQTLQKSKMRSKAPAQAALELRWAILGAAMIGLMAIKEQIARGGNTRDLSIAEALRAVRELFCQPTKRCGRRYLAHMLANAVTDSYDRTESKAARHWPHKKKPNDVGLPAIAPATDAQLELAQRLTAA